MKIKWLVTFGLLAAGAAGQTLAADGVTISGFIDLNLERLSVPNKGNLKRLSSGGLNASRLVFSGSEDLGGGSKVFFTHEMQVDADTGLGPKPRQSFVGLTGPWGSLSLGRQNTPSYWIAGYADPSWSADYSLVSNMQFFYAPFRENNSVNYNTPRINGFMGRFMAAAGQEDGTRNGRYYSTGIDYRNADFFAGFVSDIKYNKNISPNNSNIASARDNYLAVTYSFGTVVPTFIYHTYNGYYAFPPFADFQSKGRDVQLGMRWQINNQNRVFASYVHKKDDNNVKISDADGILVGYGYSLSKRTDLYVNYGHIKSKNVTSIVSPITFNNAGNANDGVQFGIRHAF